jgi:sulfide:quinone oxidoreductase
VFVSVSKKVVVLGGGVGGTMAANSLAKDLGKDEAEIILVDEDGKHTYQPGFVYLSFGRENPKRLVRDESKLLRRNVKMVVDKATRIDAEDRKIVLGNGSSLDYDYLVISTGAENHPEEIPGSKHAFHFYDIQSSMKLREALANFNGGKIVIAIGGVPYRCPPAPAEFACLLDYHFHRKGLRDKVDIRYLSPLVNIFPIEPVNPLVTRTFAEKNIKSETFFNVESVDRVKKQVHSLEGSSIDYDLLILIPPHKGVKVVRSSDLCDRGGWLITDKRTMRVLDYDDLYAMGDATNLPVSKSGAAAHYENKAIVENIASDIRGNAPESEYGGRVTCFLDGGFRKGLIMDFDYSHPPPPPKFSRLAYFKKMFFSRFYWWILPKDRLPGFVTGKLE